MATSRHISEQFDRELDSVRRHVMEMGGLVEGQVRDACTALVEHDTALAGHVADRDGRVNQLELQIDEACASIIARRQPTAGDLRLVISIIKTIADLERMGDEAEQVARQARHLADLDYPDDGYNTIRHIALLVQGNVSAVLDAFARKDADAARDAIRADVEVDAEYRRLVDVLRRQILEDGSARALALMWAVRSIERIGDHAKNIGEYVLYQVHGRDVRHGGTPDDG